MIFKITFVVKPYLIMFSDKDWQRMSLITVTGKLIVWSNVWYRPTCYALQSVGFILILSSLYLEPLAELPKTMQLALRWWFQDFSGTSHKTWANNLTELVVAIINRIADDKRFVVYFIHTYLNILKCQHDAIVDRCIITRIGVGY